MPTVEANIILPMKSAIVADAVVNTLHFLVPNLDEATLHSITIDLNTAYGYVDTVFSKRVDNSKARVKYYDISAQAAGGALPRPNPPVFEEPMTLSPGNTASAHPPELAVCMSYQAVRAAGRPQNRRRGRIYLGPFSQVGETVESDTVNTTLQTAVLNMGKQLLDRTNINPLATWVVFSPTSAAQGPPFEPVLDVHDVWVDNAWDIQRRRGLKPTQRLLYPA